MLAGSASSIVTACAACSVIHVVSARAVLSRYAWYREKSAAERAYFDQLVTSCPAITFTVTAFASALWQHPSDVTARHFGSTSTHVLGIEASIGYLLYETGLYVIHGKDAIYWLHHTLSLTALTLSLLTGQQMNLIAWQYSAELTGLPLAAVLLMQQDPVLKASLAYSVAGVMLWFLWLVTRVISLGVCGWTIARDLFVEL
jgi:hypothetical protein